MAGPGLDDVEQVWRSVFCLNFVSRGYLPTRVCLGFARYHCRELFFRSIGTQISMPAPQNDACICLEVGRCEKIDGESELNSVAAASVYFQQVVS